MDHLTDLSCKDFAKVLASRLPVPGGGGAAAMAGTLAAALCAMVGNFTSGKKKYAALEGELQQSIARCDALRLRLLELVELDAQAFEPLSRAYSIPRDHPSRQQVMEEASRNACQAPLEMVVCCSQVMALMDRMLEMGSRLLISDIGCGALLCKAALEAAACALSLKGANHMIPWNNFPTKGTKLLQNRFLECNLDVANKDICSRFWQVLMNL